MKCRVMSYNIQSCRDCFGTFGTQKQLAEFIGKYSPDVVILNEVHGEGGVPPYTTDQAGEIADALGGWNHYFAEAINIPIVGGPYGNAIISPHPIENVSVTLVPLLPLEEGEVPEDYREARCILRAEIRIGEKTLVVFGSHYGLTKKEKQYAVSLTTELLDRETLPHVFMGDLNMLPEDEILSPIFARMQDTGKLLDPSVKSFPADNPTIKIDYIFASEEIRMLSAEIPESLVSDHRPYIADIEF